MKKLLVTLVLTALLALPAAAMEKISLDDMDSVTGQAGVTIGFTGLRTTTISWNSLAWGDPDGIGSPDSTEGWLIIDGAMSIENANADGSFLELDVATAAGDYDWNGLGDKDIPDGTSFIRVITPQSNMEVTITDTLIIGLADTNTTALDDTNTLGELYLEGLSVTQGAGVQTLYIWAH